MDHCIDQRANPQLILRLEQVKGGDFVLWFGWFQLELGLGMKLLMNGVEMIVR